MNIRKRKLMKLKARVPMKAAGIVEEVAPAPEPVVEEVSLPEPEPVVEPVLAVEEEIPSEEAPKPKRRRRRRTAKAEPAE